MRAPPYRLIDDSLLTQAAYLAADRACALGGDYETVTGAAERAAERQADLWAAYLEDVSRGAV